MMKTSTNGDGILNQWICGISFLLISLVLLSGCYLPFSSSTPDSTIYENVSDLATQPVNIQFQLELPTPKLESERIIVEILDDVSGLTYNTKRYELNELSNQTYAKTLSVPSGSVIKYRYGKFSENFTPEATSDGNPVVYRMLYAAKNEIVIDVLQTWVGEPYNGGTGILRGTLIDEDTNQPIPDILINAGGQRTFSDANGKYLLEGLGEGIHNVVFYAMDGKYRSYQQGAFIAPSMTTSADVNLTPMPEVNITFQISTPIDALGAPIYIAGNITQLGNTFAELNGSMSINPKRMPALTPNEDGTHSITLKLYAETDLRYKFTLGDGYWNSEQSDAGGIRVRQLIVPAQMTTISHTVDTWRSPGIEPITFSVTIPPGTAPNDEKFIQFRTDTWTEPIPLWSLGGGKYLYILFSPLGPNQTISYQFCRNRDCTSARDTGSLNFERQVQPSETAQMITLTLDSWENWTPLVTGAAVVEAYVPTKPPSFIRIIELTPEMNPSWLVYAPAGIAELVQINADSVVFSPQWQIKTSSPYLHPEIGVTPFTGDLIAMINATQDGGFSTALFPHLGPFVEMEGWWVNKAHTEAWWNEFFASYTRLILNYANISQISGTDALILGGKSLLPAFEGGILPDGSESNIPLGFDDDWAQLINDIRQIYDGKLIWSTNINQDMDPLPDFIYEFDEIHISVDSPLALGDDPSFEMIQSGFTHLIDSQIYEIYRSTSKPITLALAYPAVETAASGCALVSDSCYNDGLFRPGELSPYMVHLDDQALIYNAILPIVASRDWITAVSIRGYDPTVIVHDGASSIAEKPAYDVIEYWFKQLKP